MIEGEVDTDEEVEALAAEAQGQVLGSHSDFWGEVGIDPVRIMTSGGTYYTLRCYLDDQPIFLGRNGRISVFGSERSLARYLADEHESDLSDLATFDDIRTAATDGSLRIKVTDDNVYVLTELSEDITDGPDAVDSQQLELAVELLRDVSDYAEDTTVDEALDPDQPLGRFVAHVLDPGHGHQAARAVRQGRRTVRRAGDLRGVAAAHRVALATEETIVSARPRGRERARQQPGMSPCHIRIGMTIRHHHRSLDVPGARLHYEVRGAGPLLFVVGSPMAAAGFAPSRRRAGRRPHRRHLRPARLCRQSRSRSRTGRRPPSCGRTTSSPSSTPRRRVGRCVRLQRRRRHRPGTGRPVTPAGCAR